MSGIVAFDDLFPLKASPTVTDRVFGFDSGDGKSRGFTIQAILDLIAETPVTWTEISGRPTVFAPAAHSLGSHSNVASGVDSATDGTFLRRVGGSWQAVAVDFYGVSNPPPADATVPDAVRGITAAQIAQWNTAFGWGNHAGQYRPVSWVPTWAEVTGKPSTFAPSAHALASHSDTTPLASASEGQVIRKAAVGWEVFSPDYYSPYNPPPPDASVPAFVRDFTIGQFAGYEEKMLEFAGLPDGTLPMIKDGVPADSMLKGVMSENPFDPVTEPVEYDAFVSELLHLISTKRIKGPDGVDADDYATLGQVPDIDPVILAALNASLSDSPGTLNKYITLSALNSYAYVQEAPINGNWYARKDGVWSAFTPFTVAGTPTAGHVVTSVAGVATWQAPSGGGLSGLTANRIIKATSATSVGDTGITEESSTSYLFGNRSSTPLANPLLVSFGASYGTSTPGSAANLKWAMWDNGTPADRYGIGMSFSLMEFRSPAGSEIGFFPSGGNEVAKFLWEAGGSRIKINHQSNSGFRLLINNVGRWSVATYGTNSDFVIYNETLLRNSIFVQGNNNRTIITELGNIPADLGYPLYVVGNAAGNGLVVGGLTWIGGDFQIIKNSGPQAAPTAIQMGSSFGNSTPGSAANLKWKLYTTTGFPANANDYGIGMTAGLMEFRAGAGASLGFFPNNGVELMRLISGGFVVIGVTTNPANTRFTVRGLGNATGVTQLWEALDGTDNVRFLDNGQILFLRLPTSATGLATGTLWNDAGTLKVA
jgi:hypothetical protein